MNIINQPTKQQIKEFCSLLEKHLIAAVDRGSDVQIGYKMETKDVTNPEYGITVIDSLYVGAKFKASYRERGY